MAILNRVVNILILLLVITAGVFSFMLFSKRFQLTDGMKQMAQAVNKTARTLDENSGSNSAGKLAVSAMDHTKYNELGRVLPELDKQAKAIIAQRDYLAKELDDIAKVFGIPGDWRKKYQHLENYDKTRLSKELRAVKSHYENVNAAFANLGNASLNASVSAAEFSPRGNYLNAIKKMDSKIAALKYENRIMRSDLGATRRELGLGSYSYTKSDTFKKALRAYTNRARDWKNKLDVANRELKKNKVTIDQKARQIEVLKKEKKELEDDNADLNNIITADGKKPVTVKRLTSDSPECYKYVAGKIVYVNNDYGFVQVDIGKNYKIIQEYGAQKNSVDFPLPAGLHLSVIREGRIIGKILVKTVNENDSICNIVKGDINDFKVGDTVRFLDDDIKKIPLAR